MSIKARTRDQNAAAAARFAERAGDRSRNRKLIEQNRYAQADEPRRVEKRLRRLRAYYGAEPVPTVDVEAAPVRKFARDADAPRAGLAEESKVLEKIIDTQDYVDVRYFEGGLVAARAVCKVNIGDGRQETGYGTGSLVSPRLMLTNHHVLPDRDSAANSQAEFNYQDSLDGAALTTKRFHLDPDAFFVADDELDFALVAIRAGPDHLAEFGFNPLIEAEGKVIVGEFVTIIQHPGGRKKQVALRENQILDIPDMNFVLHYAADTEPGSSGSPVFNDQWEVVGLHHAAQQVDKALHKGGWLNEGIRVSRILQHLGKLELPGGARALLDQLHAEGARATPVGPIGGLNGARPAASTGGGVQTQAADGALRVTIPIEVSVRVPGVEAPQVAPSVIPDPTPITAGPPPSAPPAAVEKIEIDPNYKNRKGYNRSFLSKAVPLPTLPAKLKSKAAKRNDMTGAQRHVLTYEHYSVVINKERRLAFFTAVNIDGKLRVDLRRGDDAEDWSPDPRIGIDEQTLEPVYKGDPFDRGHLVRRLDPVWGKEMAEARKANDDTFHYTNAAPQHKNLNRKTWLSLEDYILENAKIEDLKVSVFTGPVFADSDQKFQGTRIPRQFWKVVSMVKESGELSVTGYLLSQEDLIKDLDFEPEEFVFGEFKTFQVKVSHIAKLSGLSFGSLPKADPLEHVEATEAGPRAIDSFGDLVL